MLASGRSTWRVGERVRVYRRSQGTGGIVPERDDEGRSDAPLEPDMRDYDVDHYVRVLRDTFASRLERAFDPDGWSTVFADPEQPSLFEGDVRSVSAILRRID